MLPLLYPFEYVESAFTINYRRLYERGYRALIFDIDNTLVPHGADATVQTDALLQELQEIGFQTFILSNNGVARIERFIQNVPMPYLDNAKKPLPFAYKKALKRLGVSRKQAVYIGDQVFTDILGANLSGIASILVKYIGYYDAGEKGRRRDTEGKVLARYQRSKRYTCRLGNVEKEG